MVKDCWVFSFFVKFLNLGSQLILYIWSYNQFGFCFVQYSFMIFLRLIFLCSLCLIFWVCMIFSGLCSSMFLMKRIVDPNSCVFYF